MLVMRLWPSLAGPWPRCRRPPSVAKDTAVRGMPWASGLLAWSWPVSGPGPAWPAPCPVRCRLRGKSRATCRRARAGLVLARSGPWPGRGFRRLREVAPWWRGPPRGPGRGLDVLALVVDLGDASTSLEAVPLPALPSGSRRHPVPGAPRPPTGPSRPPKGAPVPAAASACRRSASWPWWTRGKVRIPARMPKPAPGPERRSQAPSRGAEPVFLYLSVCRVAWMDGRMVYILRCLTHPVSSLDDARAARHTRRRWPHAGDDPNAQ